MKLNFHRFLKTEPVEMEIIAEDKASKEIEKVSASLSEMGSKADLSGKALSKSFANISLSKGFVKTRRELKNNIRNLFSDAQKMINEGNTSGKFNINMQTQMNKFAVADVSSDDRRKAKQSEINKLLTLQKSLTTEIGKEQEKIASIEAKRVQEEQEINTSQSAFSRFSSGISTLSQGTTAISNGFKGWLRSLTGVAVTFRILGGVVTRIASAIGGMYETAASYQEAMNLYNTALGKYADQATEWANKISKALYLDPKDIMQYTGAIYNLVRGLGAGEDAAYLMSKNLTQLSYDMSSYLNIDVQSAYEKLVSAMTGQSRAIASSGVALKQGALQEKLYSLGIEKKISTLTEASKVYLRYIKIMDQTKNMQMDLGKTIITPENALRTIKTQFTLLAREIGNVFIPIVIKAVPYIMALTQILGNLAKKLADAFGFKVADVDYTSATEGADKLSKKLNGVGASAKKAKNSINRTLAAFDDLNVVESKSSSSGAGGGGLNDVTGQLSKYLKEYDMLGKLNDQFKDQVATATENLYKMFNVIKKIGVAFATWKILKLVGNFSDLITKFKLGYKEGTGLGGVIKKLSARFIKGYTAVGTTGTKLQAFTGGIRNLLGPIGQLATTVGLSIASFKGASSIMGDWNGKIGDLVGRLIGTGGLVAALSAVAAVFVGPWAAAAVAITGVIGGLKGLSDAFEKQRIEAEKQKGFPELFENTGVAISGTVKIINEGLQSIRDNTSALQQLADTGDSIDASWEKAKTAFEDYQEKLSNGDIHYKNHKELVKGITTEVDNLKKAGNDRIEAERKNDLEILDILAKETNMTKTEYEKRKKDIQAYYDMQTLMNNGYYDQYSKLLIQKQEGGKTEEWFREKVDELKKSYLGLTDTTKVATETTANYLAAQSAEINLDSPEKVLALIKETNKKREEDIDKINKSHDAIKKQKKDERDELETTIRKYKEEYGVIDENFAKKSKTNQEIYNQYTTTENKLKAVKQDIKDNETARQNEIETVQATHKNWLSALMLELSATGNDTKATFRVVVDEINADMNDIGKDVDPSKSVTDFLTKYANKMKEEGKTVNEKQARLFQGYGIDLMTSYGEGILTEFDRENLKIKNKMTSGWTSTYSNLKQDAKINGEDIGKNVVTGYTLGVDKKKNDVSESSKNMANTSINALKTGLNIHSPSKVTQELGEYVGEGFKLGIEKSKDSVRNACEKLVKTVQDTLSKIPLSVKINTDINNSLNSILSKLQTFCNKWRNAINDLMSNMKTSMNGIKVDDGKITYKSMPKVNVQKFEDGGFPKSGDLFFANENGIPEYITSVGNRSAVANQDQMVSALSGAILTAMSRIPTNTQPSNVVVYLGNDKLYEGQGQYQNRQNDRYGTTVVKI